MRRLALRADVFNSNGIFYGMKEKYIVIGAIILILIAGIVDWSTFRANGGHTETSLLKSNEATALQNAKIWVENSAPTYVFDGTNLRFVERAPEECATPCSVFMFSFESQHGGYGNREGLFVTQVITPHTIEVETKDGKVVRAITDGKYNEITGALAE